MHISGHVGWRFLCHQKCWEPKTILAKAASLSKQWLFILVHFSPRVHKHATALSSTFPLFLSLRSQTHLLSGMFAVASARVLCVTDRHTSVLFQPKLSVRSDVEALCWSTSSRLAKSLCSSSGITLTCAKVDKTAQMECLAGKKPKQCRYLLGPLACLYLPGVLVALVLDQTAPLQEMRCVY